MLSSTHFHLTREEGPCLTQNHHGQALSRYKTCRQSVNKMMGNQDRGYWWSPRYLRRKIRTKTVQSNGGTTNLLMHLHWRPVSCLITWNRFDPCGNSRYVRICRILDSIRWLPYPFWCSPLAAFQPLTLLGSGSMPSNGLIPIFPPHFAFGVNNARSKRPKSLVITQCWR